MKTSLIVGRLVCAAILSQAALFPLGALADEKSPQQRKAELDAEISRQRATIAELRARKFPIPGKGEMALKEVEAAIAKLEDEIGKKVERGEGGFLGALAGKGDRKLSDADLRAKKDELALYKQPVQKVLDGIKGLEEKKAKLEQESADVDKASSESDKGLEAKLKDKKNLATLELLELKLQAGTTRSAMTRIEGVLDNLVLGAYLQKKLEDFASGDEICSAVSSCKDGKQGEEKKPKSLEGLFHKPDGTTRGRSLDDSSNFNSHK